LASTVEGQALTEAQRVAQIRVGAQVIAQLRLLWPMLDVGNLDATAPGWLTAATTVLQQQFRLSAATASTYLEEFRAAETGLQRLAAIDFPPLPDAAPTSLMVTGPVQIKRLIGAGVAPAAAKAAVFAEVARTAQLHVLNGGRGALQSGIRSDRRALGYQRVTDGKPCYFCAMLASRGPVYSKRSFVNSRVHRGDGCTLEPVYDRDTEWSGRARQFAALWEAATEGKTGSAAIAAFRAQFNAVEGHTHAPRGGRVRSAPAVDLNATLVDEAKRLQREAQAAFKRGDDAERLRLQAEASAIWRRVYNEAGAGLDAAA